MTKRPKIYLAGPEVFLPNTAEIGMEKKRICAEHGLDGIFPIDGEVDLNRLSPFDAGMKISQKNEDIMHVCDAIIANATPWHGPSMDVGTAFEIGFMRALGKPVFVYSNDDRIFFDRVKSYFNGKIAQDAEGHWRETKHHTALEPFEMFDNLMIDGAAHASGGAFIVKDIADKEVYQSLDTFKKIVKKVSNFYCQ